MSEFDLGAAKEKIAAINSIVATCPAPLQEKCFELLFKEVFRVGAESANSVKKPPQEDVEKNAALEDSSKARKLPGNILAFLRRYNVSSEMLEKLFLLDHEPLLPVYKIETGNMAQAQLQKVMMVILENGLLSNQMKAPYVELRDSCKEDGLYDGNFNKMLKRNHDLFRGAVTKEKIVEDESIELTGSGNERLATVIKELSHARPSNEG